MCVSLSELRNISISKCNRKYSSSWWAVIVPGILSQTPILLCVCADGKDFCTWCESCVVVRLSFRSYVIVISLFCSLRLSSSCLSLFDLLELFSSFAKQIILIYFTCSVLFRQQHVHKQCFTTEHHMFVFVRSLFTSEWIKGANNSTVDIEQ